MKTAISLPDALFQEAERFAQQHGLSRSELYASALQSYLQARATTAITDALNEVYSSEDSSLDPAFSHAQVQALKKDAS
jgi:metal-responsive CopG/Arc/MetJ family transcriptional regulator